MHAYNVKKTDVEGELVTENGVNGNANWKMVSDPGVYIYDFNVLS